MFLVRNFRIDFSESERGQLRRCKGQLSLLMTRLDRLSRSPTSMMKAWVEGFIDDGEYDERGQLDPRGYDTFLFDLLESLSKLCSTQSKNTGKSVTSVTKMSLHDLLTKIKNGEDTWGAMKATPLFLGGEKQKQKKVRLDFFYEMLKVEKQPVNYCIALTQVQCAILEYVVSQLSNQEVKCTFDLLMKMGWSLQDINEFYLPQSREILLIVQSTMGLIQSKIPGVPGLKAQAKKCISIIEHQKKVLELQHAFCYMTPRIIEGRIAEIKELLTSDASKGAEVFRKKTKTLAKGPKAAAKGPKATSSSELNKFDHWVIKLCAALEKYCKGQVATKKREIVRKFLESAKDGKGGYANCSFYDVSRAFFTLNQKHFSFVQRTQKGPGRLGEKLKRALSELLTMPSTGFPVYSGTGFPVYSRTVASKLGAVCSEGAVAAGSVSEAAARKDPITASDAAEIDDPVTALYLRQVKSYIQGGGEVPTFPSLVEIVACLSSADSTSEHAVASPSPTSFAAAF